MANQFTDKTDDDLIELAFKGLTSQGPIAELMRRQTSALANAQKSAEDLSKKANRLGWWMVGLTVVTAILTAVQAVPVLCALFGIVCRLTAK